MNDKIKTDYSALDRPDVGMFLFHPRKSAASSDSRESFQEVRIPVAEGVAVGARFHLAHAGAATLLFFHGNGENVADYDDIAPLLNRLGIHFLVVDYRGYGISDGTPTASAMMADCHRIFDFTERWKEGKGFSGPMIVMGRSLGSASALELAASHPDRIDGLIIESGFAWAGPLLQRLGVDPEGIGFDESAGFANVDKIKSFDKPTAIIHAEFDHIIPFSDGRALYDASPADEKTLVTIFGANHNDIFLRGLDRYLEAIVNLTRTISDR